MMNITCKRGREREGGMDGWREGWRERVKEEGSEKWNNEQR